MIKTPSYELCSEWTQKSLIRILPGLYRYESYDGSYGTSSIVEDGIDMIDEKEARILERYKVPTRYGESSGMYPEFTIRYLRNIGMLECYYDYHERCEMIITTQMGLEYLVLYHDIQKANEMRRAVADADRYDVPRRKKARKGLLFN